MKGEVYGKRELSPLVGLSKKQAKSGNDKPAGRKPQTRKRK
jgi:small subunit ribosomal protein S3